MSKNSTRSAHSCRSTTSSPAAAAPALALRRAATLVDRLGTHEKVRQLTVGARADLLGQIGAAGSQHATDLRPQDDDRMAADDKVERRVGEGQRGRVRRADDPDAERQQTRPRQRDVRRPPLGAHQERRSPCQCGQHLAAARLDVERSLCTGQTLGHEARVAPGWALFRGAPLEPREVPALQRYRRALRHELLEASHHTCRGPVGRSGAEAGRVRAAGPLRGPRATARRCGSTPAPTCAPGRSSPIRLSSGDGCGGPGRRPPRRRRSSPRRRQRSSSPSPRPAG